MRQTWVRSLGWEDPLEKGKATYSSILAWRIPWRGSLQVGIQPQASSHSLVAQMVKNLPVMWETWVRSLSWEDPLEEGMATHSNILAWKIPWTEEPSWLQSMGSQRVGHD